MESKETLATMRMLTPRELFTAQGFGPEYVIAPSFTDRIGKTRPLTKTAQIRMVGNSVSPQPAAALIRANLLEAEGDEVAA